MKPKTISQVLEEFEYDTRFSMPNFCNTGKYKEQYVEQTREYIKDFIKSSLEDILESMPLEVKICKEKYENIIDAGTLIEDIKYGINLKVKEVKEWKSEVIK
jgi:RNA processing factor Prp31